MDSVGKNTSFLSIAEKFFKTPAINDCDLTSVFIHTYYFKISAVFGSHAALFPELHPSSIF